MICPVCFGIGEVLVDAQGRVVSRLRDAVTMMPCPECIGTGTTYCCSGDHCEPEDG